MAGTGTGTEIEVEIETEIEIETDTQIKDSGPCQKIVAAAGAPAVYPSRTPVRVRVCT